MSGNPKFFFGSDSAPHTAKKKESASGCAGVFTAPIALPLLAEVFDEHNQLGKLEGFVSKFGAEFYKLPYNKGETHLKKVSTRVPLKFDLGEEQVIPFKAGQVIAWTQDPT